MYYTEYYLGIVNDVYEAIKRRRHNNVILTIDGKKFKVAKAELKALVDDPETRFSDLYIADDGAVFFNEAIPEVQDCDITDGEVILYTL